MACCKRKGDPRKCIPFYVAGGFLVIFGLPLMIVGIVAQFTGADFVGYVGGVCIIFGLAFFLIWHMLTIENLDKGAAALDYDPTVKDIRDVVEKSYQYESNSLSRVTKKSEDSGVTNIAYVEERKNGGVKGTSSYEDLKDLLSLNISLLHDNKNLTLSKESTEEGLSSSSSTSTSSYQSILNIEIPSQSSSIRTTTSYEKTTSTAILDGNSIKNEDLRKTIPVEIV